MSSRRLGDSTSTTTLNPVVQDTITTAATVGGNPVAGLRAYGTAQITLAKPAVAGGGGADTIDFTLEDSPAPERHASANLYDGVDDGHEHLRDGAASNLEFDIPFTQVGNQTIYSITLRMTRLGTPAKAGGGTPPQVWVSIEPDNAGDPSNTTVGGLSKGELCSNIGLLVPQDITFFFEIGVDLADATPYHIVVGGDYDVSATDTVQLHYNTVAGTSTCKHYDAAWSAADVNIDYWFWMEYCVFTAIPVAQIEGGAIPQYTEDEELNFTDWWYRRELDLIDYIDDVIRIKYTVSGGTWTPYVIISGGLPKVQPCTPVN